MRVSKPRVTVEVGKNKYKISRINLAIGAAVLVGVHWNVIKKILNMDKKQDEQTNQDEQDDQ